MAKARRTPTSRTSRRRSTGSVRAPALGVGPQPIRSLVGVVLIVLGAVTAIALLLPQAGLLNRLVDDILRPLFGQGAWLLAVLLLLGGIF
ncbi:MAG: hypothetical protein H0V36_09410, partial [Chloroflexi bacterium]|nr:hypothetical protein [Chloroflexota bacterium]